jgi:hypothetical protein
MSIVFSELPDWSFDADEISSGGFKAFGRDRAGRTVEITGLDPDVSIEQCKQAALQMMSRERSRDKNV